MKRHRLIIVIAVVAFAGALGWFWQSRSAKDNGSVFYGNVDIREVNLGCAPIAAKGGITALTKNLSIELAADNIRINAVAPGIVPTPLYGELSDDQLRALHEKQPLGRYGTPDDVADAVVYLANATWVTGVILPVDGGVDAGGDGLTRRLKKRNDAC